MVFRRRAEREWERLARSEPYFAVLTDPRYRGAALTAELARSFWESGEAHVANLDILARRHFGQPLEPAAALDFGCGVGRLLMPIARRSGAALGVDASPAMLAHCAAACREAGLANVTLSDSIPRGRTFDFVNSLLVFQHIRPRLGARALAEVLGVLAPGGLLALHFLFDRPRNGTWGRLARAVGRSFPIGPAIAALRGGRDRPRFEMHAYSMNQILLELARRGVGEVHCCLASENGFSSALLLGRRAAGSDASSQDRRR